MAVPRVYPYLLDKGLIITEWIDAPTVGDLLGTPGASPSRAISAVRSAGRWLGAFHGDREIGDGKLDVPEMLDEIRTAMANAAERFRVPRRFARYLTLLEAYSAEFGKIRVPFGPKHGDFKPGNVMFREDQVIGIDLSSIRQGPILHDIVNFLLHLDLHLLHPISWRLLPLRHRLRSAFLQGYALGTLPAGMSLLAWAELQQTLRHFYERAVPSTSMAHRAIFRLNYGVCARLYARDLQGSVFG
jgi:hypothetical protein